MATPKKVATKKVATKAAARKAATDKVGMQNSATKKVATKKVAAKQSPPAPAPDDHAAITRDFGQVVNMTAAAIGKWLETKESHVVGAKDGQTGTSAGGPESVGHQSGRRIIELLGKKAGALTPDDYAHMRKVVGYVHRHLAQKPAVEEVETSRWRYSLMNWGHDPLK